jgi:hypothetical protein
MINFKKGNTVKVIGRNATLNSKIKYGDMRTVTDTCADMVQLDSIPDGWVYQCNIELAEDTSKPVFTSGEKVFIAQMNPHAGVESKRYYHAQFWCNSGHQRQYVELGLLFNNKKDAESKCRELVGLPPETKELIDGNAYMFNYQGIKGIGLYEKDESSFFMVGCSYNLENCTNIRPMTVAEIK